MKKIFTLFVGTIISVGAFAQWDTLITGTNYIFHSCCFLSNDTGYVVGGNPANYSVASYGPNNDGSVLWTTDGGNSWRPISLNFPAWAPEVNDVSFSSSKHGWLACKGGYLLRSYYITGNVHSDSAFFTNVRFGLYSLNTVDFPNDSTGFVAGENGVLFRTIDEGTSWDTLNSGTVLDINDMFFTDPANGWIVGDGGYIAATSDSGNSWTQISQPLFGFMNVQGFAYNASYANAVTVGNYGDALFSTNSGMNWTSFSSGVTTTLNKVSFANDLAGVIVGNNGVILRTQDGGNSWMTDVVPGVTEILTGICWATDTIAYICGADGRVLKSNTDISSVNSPLVNPMNASAFPNPCSDELNIVLNLENSSSVQIQITDVAGRIVLMENEGGYFIGKNIFHVNGISSLTTGMYFARAITENGVATLPVVKR